MFGKPFGRGNENGAADTTVDRHESPAKEVNAIEESIIDYSLI